MNKDKETMREQINDMRQESLRDDYHEKQMYSDADFCISNIMESDSHVQDAIVKLQQAIAKVNEYGHEVDITEFV